eukprot:COSAG02_NODE_2179_length_9586_cov_14.521395_6_plen_51_part_00
MTGLCAELIIAESTELNEVNRSVNPCDSTRQQGVTTDPSGEDPTERDERD